MKNDAELLPPPEASNSTASGVAPPVLTGGGPLLLGRPDLTGRKFSRWTVITRARSVKGRPRWNVRCACGSVRAIDESNLKSGRSRSCGCLQKERVFETHAHDLVGKTFGRLRVISAAGENKWHNQQWLCRCSCGKTKIIAATHLAGGKTTSCGCARLAAVRTRSPNLLGQTFGRLEVVEDLGFHGGRLWRCLCACGQSTVMLAQALRSGDTQSCGCAGRDATVGRCSNPELSSAARLRRRLFRKAGNSWLEVAARAKARDGYICIACGTRGGALATHHILSWRHNETDRFAMNNLVTMCRACHRQLHAIYGHDPDLDDLEEYLME